MPMTSLSTTKKERQVLFVRLFSYMLGFDLFLSGIALTFLIFYLCMNNVRILILAIID